MTSIQNWSIPHSNKDREMIENFFLEMESFSLEVKYWLALGGCGNDE